MSVPTWLIRPSSIRTVPPSIGSLTTGRTRPPTTAVILAGMGHMYPAPGHLHLVNTSPGPERGIRPGRGGLTVKLTERGHASVPHPCNARGPQNSARSGEPVGGPPDRTNAQRATIHSDAYGGSHTL